MLPGRLGSGGFASISGMTCGVSLLGLGIFGPGFTTDPVALVLMSDQLEGELDLQYRIALQRQQMMREQDAQTKQPEAQA